MKLIYWMLHTKNEKKLQAKCCSFELFRHCHWYTDINILFSNAFYFIFIFSISIKRLCLYFLFLMMIVLSINCVPTKWKTNCEKNIVSTIFDVVPHSAAIDAIMMKDDWWWMNLIRPDLLIPWHRRPMIWMILIYT